MRSMPSGRLLRLLLPLCALSAASPAPAATIALFVGVGTYKHAAETGEFRNLKGAVNDVADLKAALQQKYGLAPASTTTLLNEQATRAAILSALAKMITDAAPGDQLLFYFSGHGALVSEGFGGGGDESDRIDETIVPFDSRGPDGVKDIKDDELRSLIRTATDRGVNVVTIFDSCNSGSATRGGERNVRSRSAPAAVASIERVPAIPLAAAAPGARAGFHVHLASARDGEVALEAEENGTWRGDFTSALVAALHKLPKGASYKDLLGEIRLQLTEEGLPKQHPRGEGDLGRNFLGTERIDRRIFEALRQPDGTVQLVGGTIAGVVPGSEFAFFRSATEAAAASAVSLATGVVLSATATHATVRPSASAPAAGSPHFAKETKRRFATPAVRVKIKNKERAAQALEPIVARLGSFELVDSSPQLVLVPAGGKVQVTDPDGSRLAEFDGADASSAATAIGSYFALLGLRDGGRQPAVDVTLQKVRCDTEDCSRHSVIGPAPADESGEYRFKPGDCFSPLIASREVEKRHVYLLHLGSDFSVSLVYPGEQEAKEADAPVAPRKPVAVPEVFCMNDQPGRDYFMLIATQQPIDLSVLQQEGLRTRGQALDPLSQLLQNARHPTRGEAASVSVSDWGVGLISAVTEL